MGLDEALKALLVPSGNDAAQAIAESVGTQMMAADPSLGSDPVEVALRQACDEGLATLDARGALVPTEQGWLLGNRLYGLMWGLA